MVAVSFNRGGRPLAALGLAMACGAAIALCSAPFADAAEPAVCTPTTGADGETPLAEPEVLFEAVSIEWEYPNPMPSYFQDIKPTYYVQAHNIISGVKWVENQMFVTVPRWLSGVPATFGVMDLTTKKITPYPSWQWNHQGNCEALQSVQSMEYDASTGLLYILDTGRVNFADPDPSLHDNHCPPKLVLWDVPKNNLHKTFVFPHGQAPYETSFLNDLVIDVVNQTAYITDAGGDGAIIVYSRYHNEARRWEHSSMIGTPMDFHIDGATYPNIHTPVDGIALSPDRETLYYAPLASTRMFSVSTAPLRSFLSTMDQISATVQDLGDKGVATGGMNADSAGKVYFGGEQTSSVYSWDPAAGALTADNVQLLAHSDTLMDWVDSFGWKSDGHLLFTTTKLMRGLFPQITPPGGYDFSADAEPNFRILQVCTGTTPYMHGLSEEAGGWWVRYVSVGSPVMVTVILATALLFAVVALVAFGIKYRGLVRRVQETNLRRAQSVHGGSAYYPPHTELTSEFSKSSFVRL